MVVSLDAFSEIEQATFQLEKLATLLLVLYLLHEKPESQLSNKDYQNVFSLIRDIIETERDILDSVFMEIDAYVPQMFANSPEKR